VRILLLTGKGGVGKTTIAAATALRAADAGRRTVVCSTDPAHSLADAFDLPLADQPTRVTERLDGVQLDARARLEETWEEIQAYVVELLQWAGADGVEAEELSVVPGLDEVFALSDIKRFADSDEYDLVVVDCAPTAETIRLLSLPDVLGWYMGRFFNPTRRITSIVRPALSRLTSVPVAGEEVFEGVRRFYERLDGVRDLLTDGSVTSARLVLNPERVVVAEARRTFTYLSLFGYHVDAVVVNRLLPESVEDAFFADWRKVQHEQMAEVEAAFAPVPILTSELLPFEPVGIEPLTKLGAALYGVADPTERFSTHEPLRMTAGDGQVVLSIALPFTARSDLDLARTDRELFVGLGPHRRAIALPDSLHRREVRGARMVDGRLEVVFA
jgi:arsenite-transporting ATPase